MSKVMYATQTHERKEIEDLNEDIISFLLNESQTILCFGIEAYFNEFCKPAFSTTITAPQISISFNLHGYSIRMQEHAKTINLLYNHSLKKEAIQELVNTGGNNVQI